MHFCLFEKISVASYLYTCISITLLNLLALGAAQIEPS